MKIAIIGAGGFGTALAALYGQRADDTWLYARRPEMARQLAETRTNPVYLPGVTLPAAVTVTGDLALALAEAEVSIFAVPSQAMADTLSRSAPLLGSALAVSTAKGLALPSLFRMSEVAAAVGVDLVQLSGPSHAEEVGQLKPTAVVVAHPDAAMAALARDLLACPSFRLYASSDRLGVELAGALKNVLAIAAGILDGLGLGDNVKAALLTRGLAEIFRLGVAEGAQPMTFAGLAGLGDLLATATSNHSRNRALGLAIGRGETPQKVMDRTPYVYEGVFATRAALALAERSGVEMPIAASLAHILFEGCQPRDEVARLLARPLTREDPSGP
jgi:glycerol-3-phosphate dehydrogenase (NAD(P)+)